MFGRAAGQRRLIASTTKMMTALLTVSSVRLDRVCTAPPYAAGPLETQIGLRAGERMRVRDLLRAVLLPSANDAAATLAVCVGGLARGVRRAHERARPPARPRRTRISRRRSASTTPATTRPPPTSHGSRSPRAQTPFLRQTMDMRSAVLRSGDRARTVVNRNTLVQRGAVGQRRQDRPHERGRLHPRRAPARSDGTTFVATVLGDPSEGARDADALALLKWAFASFRVATPVTRGAVYARPAVKHRPDEHVAVVAARDVRELLRRDARVRLA